MLVSQARSLVITAAKQYVEDGAPRKLVVDAVEELRASEAWNGERWNGERKSYKLGWIGRRRTSGRCTRGHSLLLFCPPRSPAFVCRLVPYPIRMVGLWLVWALMCATTLAKVSRISAPE